VKIKPATALAVWALCTAWLLAYVVTHYVHHQLDVRWETVTVIRIVAGALGLVCYRPVRRWFATWLTQQKPDSSESA
jgi:hypothetical protein